MKNIPILLSLFLLITGCVDDPVVKDQSMLKNEALNSVEFKTAANSYAEYHTFKMKGVEELYQQNKDNALTDKAFESAQMQYIEECAKLLEKVQEDIEKFNKKFPEVAKNLSSTELMENLKSSEDEE